MTEQPGTRALVPRVVLMLVAAGFAGPVTAQHRPDTNQSTGFPEGARSDRRTQPQLVPPEPDWRNGGWRETIRSPASPGSRVRRPHRAAGAEACPGMRPREHC